MLRRIIILVTGTVAGIFAVVSYQPPQLRAVAAVGMVAPSTIATKPSSTTSSTPANTATAASTPAKVAASTPAPATTTAPAPATTTTVVGNTAQTKWGPVQVEIIVTSGVITSVKALQFPNGDRRSQSISQQAIPYLIQQTLTTQSANVLGVTGASYTTEGWKRSLASARAKAGI